MTLILGFVVKIDSILASFAGTVGWLVVLVFQIAIAATLFLARNKILDAFGKIQRATENPAYAGTMLRNFGNAQRVPQNLNHMVSSAKRANEFLTVKGNDIYLKSQEIKAKNQDIVNRTYTDYTGGKRPNLEESITQTTIAANARANPQKISKKVASDHINYKTLSSSANSNIKPSVSTNIVSVDFNAESPSGMHIKAVGDAIPNTFERGTTMASNELNMTTTDSPVTVNHSSPDLNRPILNKSSEDSPIVSNSGQAAPVNENPISSAAEYTSSMVAAVPIEKAQSSKTNVSSPSAPVTNNKVSEKNVKPSHRRTGSFTAVEVVIPTANNKQTKERPKTNTNTYTVSDTNKQKGKSKIAVPKVDTKNSL